MPGDFTAAPAATGYLYQARMALLLLSKAPADDALSIERFDDISFAADGSPSELIQTKHHVEGRGTLTDASPDIWKTLRVWSTQVLTGKVDPSKVKFVIITTASAPEGSAASLLRPTGRNEERALELLTSTMKTSESEANQSCYKAFARLGDDLQRTLLSNIRVIDESLDIQDVKGLIAERIRLGIRKEHLESVYERLEGWWFQRVILHLTGQAPGTISNLELNAKLCDIESQFRDDALPIDFPFPLEGVDETQLPQNEQLFVAQLRMVAVSQPRIKQAISDYYRAYEQRSKWVREDLLFTDELDRYEQKLVDEWLRLFLAMKENLGAMPEEAAKIGHGRELFNRIDGQVDIPIRPRCTEPYVMRGSYHMLSNRLMVGWHVDFVERLHHLIGQAEAATA